MSGAQDVTTTINHSGCTCLMTFHPYRGWEHHRNCPVSLRDVSKPDPCIGIGGGPTRATTLPDDPVERKKYPIATGVLDYFPDAIVALANLSWAGNEQHNPGQPLHWDRTKSTDEADTTMRHFIQRGTLDKDGKRHSAKAAWRMLAFLQKEIEEER